MIERTGESTTNHDANIFQSWVYVFMGVVMILCVVFIYDTLNNNRISNRIVYGTDCDYKIPYGYDIYSNESGSTYFLVKDPGSSSIRLLSRSGHGVPMWTSNPDFADGFFDTCSAKAYLREYIIDDTPDSLIKISE